MVGALSGGWGQDIGWNGGVSWVSGGVMVGSAGWIWERVLLLGGPSMGVVTIAGRVGCVLFVLEGFIVGSRQELGVLRRRRP
eukprot:1031211-Pelagomonas_calceolata.AAC.1